MAQVTVDLNAGTVLVKGDELDSAALKAAVDNTDYEVLEVTGPDPISTEQAPADEVEKDGEGAGS